LIVRADKWLYDSIVPAVPFFSSASRLLRICQGFVAMPVRDKALLIVAWCLLGLAAALLRLAPFRRLAPVLGVPIGAVAFSPIVEPGQAGRARMVRCAILRAARVAPFRSDCLPQALAAVILCRMLGVPASSHLGVRLEDVSKQMSAHAWVCSGPVAVTGGHSFGAYTAVACFIFPDFSG
jgi:mRNA-degrading endonuclease toxin of MazEF toxin-antitoxin module